MVIESQIHAFFLLFSAFSLLPFHFSLLLSLKSSIQQKLSTILDLFMQNKANFKKVKFYVNKEMKKDYEKRTLGEVGKTKPNKANSNPIKANFKGKKNPAIPSKKNLFFTPKVLYYVEF
jgi:hypothetical protein